MTNPEIDRKSPTLAEIASRAGVHQSTVSRALTADGRGVGAKTVQKIRTMAAEMGYKPNPAAAELRTGRSNLLGVLVPNLMDMVLAEIYAGIDAGAHESTYSTFVSNTQDDPELRRSKLSEFQARRVDGIILGDARIDGDELVQILKRQGIPYVLVNRRLAGHPSVTTDDVLGGALAASHLLDLGHVNVGIVAGPSFASTCVERSHGFVQKYLMAGLRVPEGCIINSGTDASGGYEAAARLLHENPEITAIFAINDFAAVGVMGAIRDHGRTPGKDIAVIGYNDVPLSKYLPVPLSSVRSPMFEMGRKGALMLIEAINGKKAQSQLLEPELIPRASTLGNQPADDAGRVHL
ncbi:LacI family DNA-binding transcriptional regulator [Paenarthrobacter sp. YAF11_1]|uniref:LacI family DNA-binding transcriptional regulator n=1 Tax=Paenarthrobacter sp. YAF11_1 TaxID=3233074 RepID=UPI003F99C4BE